MHKTTTTKDKTNRMDHYRTTKIKLNYPGKTDIQ